MFTLPALPYDYAALEPFIDAQTMQLHHDKHHQTYVDKLNDALKDSPDLQAKSVEELLIGWADLPEHVKTAVKNHGGGHANHTLFWEILGPHDVANSVAKVDPTGALATKIGTTFGSFTKFKDVFTAAATGQFGSGWAWLVVDGKGELQVMALPNQDSPLMQQLKPVMGLDVWEHAYYLKYQNRRPEYIAAFWEVLNWSAVETRFAALS